MFALPTLLTTDQTLSAAYRIAVGDLATAVDTMAHGIVRRPAPMVMAGLDYPQPWTRDAAINCWSAVSLLDHDLARDTLLGMLDDASGAPVISHQYWDKIIWAVAAWRHWDITGDRDFLTIACPAILRTLAALEADEFSSGDGLFRGGAVFQDGIAAYPDRYADRWESGIETWPEFHPDRAAGGGGRLPMKALSTNCIYQRAYLAAAALSDAMGGGDGPRLRECAQSLAAAIRRAFWDETGQRLRYLVDDHGGCDRQEGLGIAYSLLFGLLTDREARAVIAGAHTTPHGLPCVWPTYDRYAALGGYGRHSGMVWPQVQGFWAEAAALYGAHDAAWREVTALSRNIVRSGQCAEIYHPDTGIPDGGLQEDPVAEGIKQWDSMRRQTWTATALIGMVNTVLCGLRVEAEGIRFAPWLPADLGPITVTGLRYRGGDFEIHIAGSGAQIASCAIDGTASEPVLRPSGQAARRVEITLG